MLKGYTVPRTPLGKSSLNPPPWHYSGDVIGVEFWASPDATAATLPQGLTPDPDTNGHAVVMFIDWQFTGENDEYLDPARYQYREFLLLVDARYGDRRVAWCPYIFVDNDAALARGWIQGIPKRLASVYQTRSYVAAGGRFGASMSACGQRLVDARVTLHESVADPSTRPVLRPSDNEIARLAGMLHAASRVTLMCGAGCAGAHDEVVELAKRLKAPVVHSLRGKESIEHDNPYDVGMTGMVGFASGYAAMKACDMLLLLGTDFPYRQFYPEDAKIAQIDVRPEALGNRCSLDLGLLGTVEDTLAALLPHLNEKTDSSHLDSALAHYGKARKDLDALAESNPSSTMIHPQYVTRLVSQLAADDAIFTCDVGTPIAWTARYLKLNGRRRLVGSFNHGSMAKSAGSLITSVGGVWLDFGPSSATSLQSTSALGTFTSSGTGGQIHNTFTLELSTTYFVTDHIAFDLAAGIPPKLQLYAQGNAPPFGAGGPSLNLGNLAPLATTRSWSPILFLKYYFFDAQTKLRPFVGIGGNYTWFSHTNLNSTFSGALQQIAGPGGQVKASLSPSWNPAVSAGAAYNISKNWYASGSVTYLSLKTNATVSSVAANGQTVLSSKTRITADPVIVFLGIGYRF